MPSEKFKQRMGSGDAGFTDLGVIKAGLRAYPRPLKTLLYWAFNKQCIHWRLEF